jgi:hypothetical protein
LSFNAAVSSFATTDIFGDIKNPSGFNLYVKLNANLSNGGLPNISVAPEKGEVPYGPILDVIGDASSDTLDISYEGGVYDGVSVLVSATPALSQGKSNVKSEFRGIGYTTGAAGVISVGSAYVEKFGPLVVGGNVTIKIEPVIATGQKGTAQTARAVISA